MDNKVLEILKQAPYFNKQNLGLVLGKEGKDLSYWVGKLISQKLLIPLKKGLYISSYYRDLIAQNPSDQELYLIYLANILRSPSYVSLEYVLSRYNIIPESLFAITSITSKSSRAYSSELTTFVYRNVKEELFFGYESEMFKDKTVRMASKAKALFDFLYFKRFNTKETMRMYLFKEGRINWDCLEQKDKIDLIKTVDISSSKKMQSIVTFLKKENIL